MSRFKKTQKAMGTTYKGDKPNKPDLYSRVVSEAKKKFDRWPSAYASSWVVKTYKERGGGYG